jgi:hypothetical protein
LFYLKLLKFFYWCIWPQLIFSLFFFLYSSEQAPASLNGSSDDYILFDDHDSSENESSSSFKRKPVVTITAFERDLAREVTQLSLRDVSSYSPTPSPASSSDYREPPPQSELPATERLYATSGSPGEELPWLEQPSFLIHPRITALQKQGLLLSYSDVQVSFCSK